MALFRRCAPLVLLLLIACRPTQQGPAVLRVGYFPNITHSQPLIGMANGAFEQALGSDVRVEPKVFNAGPSEIEALFAGELDLAYVGPNPAINGFVRSKGQALRIIAGATSGGAVLVVRRDSGITRAADLDGKRIATPELGNTQDVAARSFLLSNSLQVREKGGTVSILPTKNPDILTLFIKREVDAAWVPEPWGARLVREGNGSILLDERTLWEDSKFVTAVLVARTEFAASHPELVKKWVAAHVELTEWIRDHPADAKLRANSEIARLTGKGLDPSVLDDAWGRIDVTFDPLSTSLLLSADRAFQLGFLGKEKANLQSIYDLTYLKPVLAEKGITPLQ